MQQINKLCKYWSVRQGGKIPPSQPLKYKVTVIWWYSSLCDSLSLYQYGFNSVDAARRFFQSKCEESALKARGTYDNKVKAQRRRNRLVKVWHSVDYNISLSLSLSPLSQMLMSVLARSLFDLKFDEHSGQSAFSLICFMFLWLTSEWRL